MKVMHMFTSSRPVVYNVLEEWKSLYCRCGMFLLSFRPNRMNGGVLVFCRRCGSRVII